MTQEKGFVNSVGKYLCTCAGNKIGAQIQERQKLMLTYKIGSCLCNFQMPFAKTLHKLTQYSENVICSGHSLEKRGLRSTF